MRWHGPEGYWASDDPALIDVDLVHDWISRESYWAKDRPRDVMARSIEQSLVLGLYTREGEQVGFARRFGVSHYQPFMRSMDAHPKILEILKEEGDTKAFGALYDTDQMNNTKPAKASILNAT